jgi:hypothetical protein
MTRFVFGAAALLMAVALTGCTTKPPPIVPVEGVVLLDGAPLPKVKVLFFPQGKFDASQHVAQGVTDDEGRFKLTCLGQDGACACENIVTIMDDVPEELSASSARQKYYEYMNSLKNRPVPAQLRSAATSPARVTVTAGQKEYKIELQRPAVSGGLVPP